MTQPHILVVDDDIFVIDLLTDYLENQGYRVSTAFTCQQAIGKLKAQDKVNLVILDYLMPDGSGTDVLMSLGQDAAMQKPPVIMSSGILEPDNPLWRELRKHLPAVSQSLIHAYVCKPYTLEAMDVALQEVLGGDYIPGPRLAPKHHARDKSFKRF